MEDLDTRVLRSALSWQHAGVGTVLVTVVRTWGSAPRPPGSLMAINERGETAGSISGGCIEDDLIHTIREQGIQALNQQGKPSVMRYGISADQAHRFGLPCGGTLELVLETVRPHSQLDALLQALLERRPCQRSLDLNSGEVSLQDGPREQTPRLDEQQLTCWFGPQARLLVIGAGDLSAYLCQIALGLGFEITVCDPREEHRATWDLPGVTLSHEMPDDMVLRLAPDARTAVVALTHDPRLDDLALIYALQSPAFYVGAIGSRRNSDTRRQRLAEHFGLSAEQLDRLHGPAGLYIGSKTPAEIALSIMAEVVAAKNGIATSALVPVAAGKSVDESLQAADSAGCVA